jgi:transposase
MKTLEVLNLHAAGLDLGSEKIHASVAGESPRVFGTFTADVLALRDWLRGQKVETVAVEATGIYWLTVYEVLEAAGLQVVVVNGKHVKNLPGRKTDLSDCQWLATLHAHGLLRGSFVPPESIRRLQDYLRLRGDHISMAAAHIQHLQKALERMNIKVHDVLSNLVGASGQAILRAILGGERDPRRLAALAEPSVQKKKGGKLLAALQGTWRAEHLFALQQAFALWECYQQKISECDAAIAAELAALQKSRPPAPPRTADAPKPKRASGANRPQIPELPETLRQISGGVEVTRLPGMGEASALPLLGEVGLDLTRWKTEKQFTSWLGLAPASHQSGKRQGRVSRQRNRAGRIFCTLARSLARSVDKSLGGFYRGLRGRRGGLIANQALARKLAVLYWRSFTKGLQYVESGLAAYEEKRKVQQQHLAQKLAAKLGCQLVPLTVVHG